MVDFLTKRSSLTGKDEDAFLLFLFVFAVLTTVLLYCTAVCVIDSTRHNSCTYDTLSGSCRQRLLSSTSTTGRSCTGI